MAIETTLTSVILNPWATSSTPYTSGDQLVISYADLSYIASASDSYKSTAGDVFKVYVDGVRIYRTSDSIYAGGSGFLEDGDIDNSKLAGISATWASTTDTVWTIDTANQKVTLDTGEITGSTLYGSGGKNVSFSSGSTIIELRRSVQDQSAPSIDFSNASILTEQDLDNSSANVFHMAQQAIEKANNALPYDVGTGVFQAYQPGTTTKKKIAQVADGTATNDAVNKGQLSATETTTLAYKEDTEDYKLETADWATKVNGVVNTYTDNVAQSDGTDQSAKAYAIGGTGVTQTASKGASKEWAIGTGRIDDQSSGDYSSKEWATGTTATSSKTYATKVDGAVTGTDFSSKAWAIGGTNVTTTTSRGSAKEWATASGLVDTASYSAKEYSQSSTAGTSTYGGSAKGWSQTAYDTAVPGAGGSDRSALHYSTLSANSATAAKNSAAAVASTFDSFDDTYLGIMADGATATDADTTGTWAINSNVITVASKTNIIVGQEVTGAGIPVDANVISISSSEDKVTISENMTAAGSGVDLDFRGQGVYGAFNVTKDGPATDNDGGALANGMLYFNTTDNSMKVYKETGAAWIKTSASGGVSLVMHKAVASGTPTSFAASDFTPTLSYEVNNIVVWLNGVKLDSTDFVATSGTTITDLAALANADELVVLAFKTFEVGDAVSAASGGTFGGNVSFGDNNITNVGSIALDSISADGTGITINDKLTLKKEAFMKTLHNSWVMGG